MNNNCRTSIPWNGRTAASMMAMVAIILMITACGKKEDAATLSSSIKNTWKKVDLPPGADPSVPDTLGGNGFEKIAEQLGFSTYVVTDTDKELLNEKVYKGGEISTTISRFPLSFRPFFYGPNANFTENSHISSLCYENLIGVHPISLEFIPRVASHWKISEDKSTFTFRIDPNARFWDGNRITAEDVVESFRLVMDESMQSPSLRMSFEKFDAPVALSTYLVQVHCREQNWRNFLTIGGNLNILQAAQIKNMTGREFVDKFQFEMPIGSGPYIVLPEDVVKQESYKFTRRADYWAADYDFNKTSNNFDKLVFHVIKDQPNLEYERFKRGEADYYFFTSITTDKWISDTTYEAISNNWVKRHRIFTHGPAGTYGYFFNLRQPPFNDIRVRMAFAKLLDRKSIIEKVLFNEYEPIYSFYGNSSYESPACPHVEFDPDGAAKLLAEAGWTSRNADGFLVKNGKPFVVELGIIKPLEKFVTPYKETMRQAGIDLQIKYVDGNALSQNMMQRSFGVTVGNYGGLVFPNPETSLSSVLADKKDNNNVWGFKNARVDQIIKEYALTFDQATRTKLIMEVDSIVTNDYLVAFWWMPRGIRLGVWDKFGMPKGKLGRYTQVGDHDLAIMTGWWIDPEKQKKLNEAKAGKKPLPGTKAIVVDRYWKEAGN